MAEYAAVVATLAGVIVGGLINFMASRTAKRHEWQLTLARDQIQRRELLYSEYLAEARRLTSEAIFRQLEVPKDLGSMDKMLAQMSLLSPTGVTEAARELRRYLVRTRSSEKDLSAEEPAINQLSKTFIDAARADLGTFRDGSLP